MGGAIPVRQRPIPEYALCRVTFAKGRTHWVVKWGNRYYDPGLGMPLTLEEYLRLLGEFEGNNGVGARVTSTVELRGLPTGGPGVLLRYDASRSPC
jgi:hypothetical protein